MNRPVTKAVFPSPPARPTLFGGSPALLRWVEQLHDYFTNERRTVTAQVGDLIDQVNNAVQGVGPDLDSGSGVLTPTNAIHGVTGGGTIATINAPDQFSGPAFFIALGPWSLVTGGNIAASANPVLNHVLTVVYSSRSQLWYPS